ncbi:hypothetical protein [Pseudomonas sp. Pseu.R1]|uniref:hypothetical protein n=1 Tax=Pseudomonas sp. Pseu.R1 TaxID=3379818 RepID=UPI003B966BE3
MEFVDCVDNNIFLKSIFPSGVGDVLVGQFGLDQGQFSLNIHVFKKPFKEVAKWGVWGVNYDAIVIKLLGAGVSDIKIDNWNGFVPAPLKCWVRGDRLFLSCQTEEQVFEISCFGLAFQSGSTYIN